LSNLHDDTTGKMRKAAPETRDEVMATWHGVIAHLDWTPNQGPQFDA